MDEYESSGKIELVVLRSSIHLCTKKVTDRAVFWRPARCGAEMTGLSFPRVRGLTLMKVIPNLVSNHNSECEGICAYKSCKFAEHEQCGLIGGE